MISREAVPGTVFFLMPSDQELGKTLADYE